MDTYTCAGTKCGMACVCGRWPMLISNASAGVRGTVRVCACTINHLGLALAHKLLDSRWEAHALFHLQSRMTCPSTRTLPRHSIQLPALIPPADSTYQLTRAYLLYRGKIVSQVVAAIKRPSKGMDSVLTLANYIYIYIVIVLASIRACTETRDGIMEGFTYSAGP